MGNTQQQADTEDTLRTVSAGSSMCSERCGCRGRKSDRKQEWEEGTEMEGKRGGEREQAGRRERQAGGMEKHRRISTPFYRGLSPREDNYEVHSRMGIKRAATTFESRPTGLRPVLFQSGANMSFRRALCNKGAETSKE